MNHNRVDNNQMLHSTTDETEHLSALFPLFIRTLLLLLLAGILLMLYPSITGHAATWKATADVNVRDKASMDSSVITSLKKGMKVKQTGIDGHWIAVSTSEGTGYVYYKYLEKVPDTMLYVKADAVNLRQKPTTESRKLGLLYRGQKVLMLDEANGWFKVRTKKGKVGFMCGDYMSRKKVNPASEEHEDDGKGKKGKKKKIPSFRPDENTGRRLKEAGKHSGEIQKYRHAAISNAKNRLGNKYSQDKRNKKGYADCSSLMRDIFKDASGGFIGDTTTSQARMMNEFIYPISSVYDVSPGDIVYHLSSDNHAGIYLGDGKVLHASQGKGKVIISSFPSDGSYWEYGCNAALFCAVQ